jgi:hypothetical protein
VAVEGAMSFSDGVEDTLRLLAAPPGEGRARPRDLRAASGTGHSTGAAPSVVRAFVGQRGPTWFVRDGAATTTHLTRPAAVEAAHELLRPQGGEVLVLDAVGLVCEVIVVPRVGRAQGSAPAPAPPPLAAPAPAPPPRETAAAAGWRPFLVDTPARGGWEPWGEWRVRRGPAEDALEVEVVSPATTSVCYLVADREHSGVNAVVLFGDALQSLLSALPGALRTPQGTAALRGTAALWSLATQEVSSDGLGWASLRFSDVPSGYGWPAGGYLLYTDAEPAPLATSPHTRLLVKGALKTAISLLTDLASLGEALHAQPAAVPRSFWSSADAGLEWAERNVGRTVSILKSLDWLLDL